MNHLDIMFKVGQLHAVVGLVAQNRSQESLPYASHFYMSLGCSAFLSIHQATSDMGLNLLGELALINMSSGHKSS